MWTVDVMTVDKWERAIEGYATFRMYEDARRFVYSNILEPRMNGCILVIRLLPEYNEFEDR